MPLRTVPSGPVQQASRPGFLLQGALKARCLGPAPAYLHTRAEMPGPLGLTPVQDALTGGHLLPCTLLWTQALLLQGRESQELLLDAEAPQSSDPSR